MALVYLQRTGATMINLMILHGDMLLVRQLTNGNMLIEPIKKCCMVSENGEIIPISIFIREKHDLPADKSSERFGKIDTTGLNHQLLEA